MLINMITMYTRIKCWNAVFMGKIGALLGGKR
jgi:hypothetical protein